MADGGAPALCFMRMGIIRDKLAEVGITKSDQEANLHALQCLWSDCALDKKLLQHTPNMILKHIEDRGRTTHRELEERRKPVDGSDHARIASGRPENFPAPGHHQGNWDGPGKGGKR